MVAFAKDLDTPLLRLSAEDNFTLRDGCAGLGQAEPERMLRQGVVALLVFGLGYRPGQLIRDGQPWCAGRLAGYPGRPVRTGGVSPGSLGRGCRRRRGGGRDGQGACRGDDDGLGSAQPDFPVS